MTNEPDLISLSFGRPGDYRLRQKTFAQSQMKFWAWPQLKARNKTNRAILI
jgi:hypothetical protein